MKNLALLVTVVIIAGCTLYVAEHYYPSELGQRIAENLKKVQEYYRQQSLGE